jgi:hypothetical protein
MSRVLIVRRHIPQLTNEIAIMKQVTHVNAVQLYEVVVRMAAPYSLPSLQSLIDPFNGHAASGSAHLHHHGIRCRVSCRQSLL